MVFHTEAGHSALGEGKVYGYPCVQTNAVRVYCHTGWKGPAGALDMGKYHYLTAIAIEARRLGDCENLGPQAQAAMAKSGPSLPAKSDHRDSKGNPYHMYHEQVNILGVWLIRRDKPPLDTLDPRLQLSYHDMNSKPTGWASNEAEAGSKAALAKDDAAWKATQESHFANHGSAVQWKCFTG